MGKFSAFRQTYIIRKGFGLRESGDKICINSIPKLEPTAFVIS